MKAWRGEKPGLEHVHLVENHPIPELKGEYDVLIKVIAVGLNPVDYKRAAWPNSTYPFTLGLDTCGLIAKVGEKVDPHVFVEKETLVLLHGSLRNEHGYFAEYAIHDSRYLSIVPKDLYQARELVEVASQLAALPCAAYTAYQIICNKLRLPLYAQPQSSDMRIVRNIVVSAGAGGVGGFCLQYLKLWKEHLPQDVKDNLKIIATCSSKNADFVKHLGATHVVDYNEGDLVKKLNELSDGNGVDIFIDNVGAENRRLGADSLNFGGELAVVVEGGEDIPLNTFFGKAQTVHCVMLGGAYGTKQHDKMTELKKIGDEVLKLFSQGKIDAMVSEIIPFEGIHEALGRLKERHVKGKIVAQLEKSE